jgi:hypothetical protein
MKYPYMLIALGCLAFSPVHAESAYSYDQSKTQAQGRFLINFWEDAQLSQAFVDVFCDSLNVLPIKLSAANLGFSSVTGDKIKAYPDKQVVDSVEAN